MDELYCVQNDDRRHIPILQRDQTWWHKTIQYEDSLPKRASGTSTNPPSRNTESKKVINVGKGDNEDPRSTHFAV